MSLLNEDKYVEKGVCWLPDDACNNKVRNDTRIIITEMKAHS